MRSRSVFPLRASRQLLLLGLVVVAIALAGHEAARPVQAVGEGTFGLDKAGYCQQVLTLLAPGYCTTEGTAVPITVIRSGGAVLTQDVVLTVQLSEGTVDEDYPSGTITQTYTFKQGTNETSKTFMFQTLNKSRYFTRSVRVTILSVTAGAQIDYGASTAPVHLLGIFAPTVTKVTPRSAIDGTTLTITGTNFGSTPNPVCPPPPTEISTGSPSCVDRILFVPLDQSLVQVPVGVPSFNVVNPNTITLLVPGGMSALAEYDVVVEVQTGQASPNQRAQSLRNLADRFVYRGLAGATVTGVFPTSGPASGGTFVQLTGNGGLSCAIAGTILFDGLALPIVPSSCVDLSITGTINVIRVISPAHGPGVIDIRANGSPATQETKYTYTGGPKVTAITPAFGPVSGGTMVVITGSGFLAQLPGPSVLRVLFGGNDTVNPLFQTDTQITAIAPPGTGVQQVTVRTTLGDSPYTTAANFTYTSGPVIQAISPNNGPVTGGTVVTISGTGFLAGAVVKFGANSSGSVIVDGPTAIRAVSPAGAGNVDIVVTVNGNPSPNTAADNFSYTGPSITLVSPNAGPLPGGNQVSIKGLNFTSTATVKFGSIPVPQDKVIFVSQNELTVTAPASTGAQVVDIVVHTISGDSTVVPEDLYTYTSGPIVDAINPNTGPTTGGQIVIITGKNFTAGLTVKFGDVNVDNLNVNSATQITLLTPPAAAAGIKDVRVTKGADTSPISVTAKFTYVAAVPIITLLDPNSGSTFGGQEVTIVGAGFSGVVCPGAVKFGTVPALSCTMVNDTTLKAVAPPNVSGQTVVTVTTTNGTSDIVPNFTYKTPGSTGGTGGTAPPPPGPAGTISYSLTFRWTLLTWFGRDGISIGDALRGYPATAGSDITTRISAIFRWDAENTVYKAYFTLAEGIPGANDFSTLTRGAVYWIASVFAGEVQWTVQAG